ncbi:MAG: efflux RND transporter permease subunit, partial [Spirochaetes bacterium]|nr:efflux RND transporter permease subunit [Spirochaetota bacterium]
MRGLINLFVRRPVTVVMILAALIIAAVFSLFITPVNRLPDFSVPRVTVETIYPGMAANEIRMLVTIPLEDGLSPVKGLEKMKSISRDSRSIISMDFRWGTDPMAASVLVREAVDAVYPALPEGVRKPSVTSGDTANEPHAVIAVSSRNGNAEFARNLAEYELRARLRRIDGVGSIVLIGGEIMEERLILDTPRIAALGFAPQEFAGLLAQETSDVPAGNAREGSMELVIISSGRPDSADSLSQVVLPAAKGTLTVSDAGRLKSSAARSESVFVYNGKEAAALEIFRRSGSDPLRLSREIKKTVDEANILFSRDAQIEIVSDAAPSLIRGITGLLISAAIGAAAVILILLLFIRRLKYSLLASLSIPVSAAAGICALSVTGRSLNSMSLSGLAMGIGLVSDTSVIVLDLLHQAFGKTESVPLAEEIGNKAFSIAGSSIASTLTTSLVFLPIIMLPGPLGSLFGDIAVALVTSVAAGWFYAQFCLPSLYRIVPAFNVKIPAVFKDGSLKKNYGRFLLFLLRRPGKIFIIVLFSVIAGIFMMLTRPVVFINTDEAEEVWVSMVYPSGTVLETVGVTEKEISLFVSGLPSVKTVFGRAGAEEEDIFRRADIDYSREEFILRCVLKKGTKPEKALAEIKAAIVSKEDYRRIPLSVYFPKDRTEVLLGLSTDRTFVIKGNDREELFERTEILQDILNTASIDASFRPQGKRPELRLYPDREAAAYLSISAAQIAETLYVLNEGIVATRLEIKGKPLDVRVTGQNNNYGDIIQQLEQIPIKTSQGKTVYLGSLGRIERMEAEAALARLDRSDVIYTDISAVKNNSKVLSRIAAEFSWFSMADESAFGRYRNLIVLYVILVLILLYMTMGAQFESFLLPLILMMSIPFSLAGAGFVLLITGTKIDSNAVLGLTALFGLVVNNSLILFEVSEQKID